MPISWPSTNVAKDNRYMEVQCGTSVQQLCMWRPQAMWCSRLLQDKGMRTHGLHPDSEWWLRTTLSRAVPMCRVPSRALADEVHRFPFLSMPSSLLRQDKTRPDQTRPDKTRQDKRRQAKTRQQVDEHFRTSSTNSCQSCARH